MQIHLIDLLRNLAGLVAGGGIGLAFGILQRAALRRHEELERSGKLKSGWSLMPGSGARVAYLLIALLLVQLICPLLFVAGTQWWVSAGLVAGYGWLLYRQLRMRMREVRS
ncbi:MAG TPA: hypothetical protein VKC51_02695 [Lacunisphaera sp.]|nr:hypothetical protein [Lacunisphaera sp.]